MARIKYYNPTTQSWEYADEAVSPFPDGTNDGDVPMWDDGEWGVGSVTGKEDKSNKVTSISAQSTDTQYPSAKCIYDLIGGLDDLIGTGVIE